MLLYLHICYYLYYCIIVFMLLFLILYCSTYIIILHSIYIIYLYYLNYYHITLTDSPFHFPLFAEVAHCSLLNSVRDKIARCIFQIFKEDKRGQLSVTIVQKLNQYIKSKKHSVHPEVIAVLPGPLLQKCQSGQENEDETKQKKLMSHEQRILALSRRR